MGKTSSKVKRRWNDEHYDRIVISVPKGQKDAIKAYAESKGESVSALIARLIGKELEEDS